jgi:hypothetical protein
MTYVWTKSGLLTLFTKITCITIIDTIILHIHTNDAYTPTSQGPTTTDWDRMMVAVLVELAQVGLIDRCTIVDEGFVGIYR